MQYRNTYLAELDDNAKSDAEKYRITNKISRELLLRIIELYRQAQGERDFYDDLFESAYHSPITGYFEFYFARFLYHYSIKKNWAGKYT